MRRGETRDGNPVRRAAHVVEPQAVADGDRRWVATVLATDTDLQVGTHLAAALGAHSDQLAHAAVATSGDYMQPFTPDFKQHHILDPRTGWPVEDLASVTVIAADGALADAAATALIVAGLDEWQEVARSLNLDQVMMIDETGKVYQTAKMAERIELESGVEFEIVEF